MKDRDSARDHKKRTEPNHHQRAQPAPAHSVDSFLRATAVSRPPFSPTDVLALQRNPGNRAVQRILARRADPTIGDRGGTTVARTPGVIQRDDPDQKSAGPEPGLNTGQGRITDWAVAV